MMLPKQGPGLGQREVLEAVLREDAPHRAITKGKARRDVPAEIDARMPLMLDVDEGRVRVGPTPHVQVLLACDPR